MLSATVRRHLNADALFKTVRSSFAQVAETRADNPQIAVADALMSAFAMFSLKDPSLLAFDHRRENESHNLRMIYGVKDIPCDTQMRTIIDPVPPDELRPAHNAVYAALQRGKALEKMLYLEEGYLMPMDGTGYFSSDKLFSDACMMKVSSTGKVTYYLQMLGAAIVHPERREVIPMIPEIISRQDGTEKNDCEMNASRRLIEQLRREHPHLKIVVTQDANAVDLTHHELRPISPPRMKMDSSPRKVFLMQAREWVDFDFGGKRTPRLNMTRVFRHVPPIVPPP